MIDFDGRQLRRDIALRARERARAGSTGRTETAVETEFEGIEVDAPRVGIVMGSKSDMAAMEKAAAGARASAASATRCA